MERHACQWRHHQLSTIFASNTLSDLNFFWVDTSPFVVPTDWFISALNPRISCLLSWLTVFVLGYKPPRVCISVYGELQIDNSLGFTLDNDNSYIEINSSKVKTIADM